MPRQRINNLGGVGLNTDVVPSELPQNAWTTLYNCATQDGALRSVIGERKLFDLSLKPLYHRAYIDGSQLQWLIVSDGLTVIAYDMQGNSEDITPTAGAFSGGAVTFTSLNGVLVVNSETDGPFYWAGSGSVLEPLPGWDSNWRCKAIASFKYYLVAMNTTESGADYPHKVRWSNSAAEGELPTEWVASNANDAGADLIGETDGVIIGSALVRDALWIIKEDAIYEMRWIGGEWIMQLSRMKGGIGTRLPGGYCELKGGMAVMTTSDLLLFDGNQTASIVDARVRAGLFNVISEELWERSVLFDFTPASTMLVAFVNAGNTQLSSALLFNYGENTWGHKRLNFSYGFDLAFVTFSSNQLSWDELGVAPFGVPGPKFIAGATWDEQIDGSWNKGVYQPSTPDLVIYESNAEDTAWWVSIMALTHTDSNGRVKTCHAQRTGLPIEGADGLAMVTEVWPEIEGSIPLQIKVGGSMSMDGDVVWDKPITFTPGKDFVITPRVTARFVALDIESQGNGMWKLGALTFNWERAGER